MPVTTGKVPSPRVHSTLTIVDKDVYLFGGRDASTFDTLNSLYSLNTQTRIWQERTDATGTPPSPRYLHGAIAVDSSIYYFSGRGPYRQEDGDKANLVDDLHILTIRGNTLAWSQPECSGPTPTARWDPVVDVYKCRSDILIRFIGGRDAEGNFLRDVLTFNTSTNTWLEPESIDLDIQKLTSAATRFNNGLRIYNHVDTTGGRTLFDPWRTYETPEAEAEEDARIKATEKDNLGRLPRQLITTKAKHLALHAVHGYIFITGIHNPQMDWPIFILRCHVASSTWVVQIPPPALDKGSWGMSVRASDESAIYYFGESNRSSIDEFGGAPQEFSSFVSVGATDLGIRQAEMKRDFRSTNSRPSAMGFNPTDKVKNPLLVALGEFVYRIPHDRPCLDEYTMSVDEPRKGGFSILRKAIPKAGPPVMVKFCVEATRFEQELYIMNTLNMDPNTMGCLNIMRHIDFFEKDDLEHVKAAGVFVFPYGEVTVDDYCRSNDVRTDDMKDIVKSVANGLVALWKAGIVHADIKPANIMMFERESALGWDWKIIDFDSALKIGKPVSSLTIGYCPPETICLNADDILPLADPRMDIFSLGQVIYFLHNTEPYGVAGREDLEILEWFKNDEPIDLTGAKFNAVHLQDLAVGALKKKSTERLSPEELAAHSFLALE